MKYIIPALFLALLLQAAPAVAQEQTLEEELAAVRAELNRETRAMGEQGEAFSKDAEADQQQMKAMGDAPEGTDKMTGGEIADLNKQRLEEATAIKGRSEEFMQKQEGHVQRVQDLSARIVELNRLIEERDAAAKAEAQKQKEAEGAGE